MTAGREIRETGHAWLPEIPADWQFVPSKALFANRAQHSKTNDVHLTPSQKYGVVTQDQYMQLAGSKVVLNLTGSDSMKHVEPGDFIIHLRSFQGGLERSLLVGKVSLAYTVLKPRQGVLGRYFQYLLKSDRYIQAIRVVVNQLRDGQSIRYQDFGKVPLPLPSAKEQQVIANFLDRETAKIDALIEKQNELVALLLERRAATISRALARRLGWAGWQVRHIAAVPVDAGANETGDPGNATEWPRFIRTTDIASMDSLFDDRRVTVDPENQVAYGVQRDDILATRAGATVGKSYIHESDEPAVYAGYLVRIRVNRRVVLPRYVAFWMQSSDYWGQVAVGSIKSTIENFSASKYRALRLPLPPLSEQQSIIEHLNRETARIDSLITKAEAFVAFAQERRAALITAAVTGQIDVVGEAV